MKSLKRNIAYILVLAVCFSGVTAVCGNYPESSVVANAEEEEKVYKGWSYVVYDKIDGICDTPCVELTKYNPTISSISVDIPSEIEGYPVVSISGEIFEGRRFFQMYIPSSIKRFGEGFEQSIIKSSNIMIDYKFDFQNRENGGMELVSYISYDKEADVEIPETVAGIPVTAVCGWVFESNKNIKSVKIPDTVDYFGYGVFKNSSLESVNIPKAMKIVPNSTFSGCSNLKSVEFHENLIISKSAFKDTDFKLPDNINVSEMGTSSSYGNIITRSDSFEVSVAYNETTNTYEAEILSYDPNAVSGTTADVVIPEYFMDIPIKEVSEQFWNECNDAGINLGSITFPSEITTINKFNLDNPETFKYLNIKGSNIDIQKDAFRNTGIEELILDGSCTLNSAVFLECKNLKRVEFTGDSPTVKISDSVFRNCTALEEIVFPDNVDLELSMDSLGYCTSLKELTLNGKIRVNSNACRGCDSLEKITLSGDVKFYSNSFADNRSLTDIIIDTDKTIEGNAFNGCSSLMNINSVPVFDTETKQFSSELSDFVMNNFNSADNVGFINLYIQARTDEFIDEYIDDSMNDMQKIKTVHDWICSNVRYDYETTKERKNHNDASAFMNDSSVCEGYARCYNILLNAAGIETYYVMSENHAWNVIKLGGHYFHSDTTWDDSNEEEISYDWFLRSDDEAKSETSSHSSWKLNMPSPLHSFQSAELPLCEYSMGDINTDGSVNVADLVQLNKYIMGKSSVSGDDIILADLNYDGVTDIFDMVCMRKIVAGIK
ncbi:MAG: leucine-rich repeat protein [Ruminococcus sp.]|nr:leucine-rich repeat protein [Ruminococcus sp.]